MEHLSLGEMRMYYHDLKVQFLKNGKEENSKISLSITDDGKGFDVSVQSKGIGFINIYNRVDAFGGDMELISSPGNGCSLKINFPLILN